ncbi:MAG: aryl-sulfate sulfotransferase [Planctomycetota bacterium]
MRSAVILGVLIAGGIAQAQGPYEGRTLISPGNSTSSFLVDMQGNPVKTWHGARPPGLTAHMLPDQSLLRPCTTNGGFMGGGLGGRIQKINASDQVVWDFNYATTNYHQHHDAIPMPNGNVLLIAWERKTQAEAIAAGRQNIYGEMWPERIVEIQPVGAAGGNVVWEWHLWDHLIQDVDPGKPNYGVVADHPELLDINYGNPVGGDWMHANALDYNPELDQIIFSSHYMSELYIIDHSTTTAEAAGHTGGRSGMGGDFLYRWGNPAVYRRGTASNQYFFVVHGANWIDPGLPGAGNLLAFNNGDRPGSGSDYSSIDEIIPPLNANGTYDILPGQPFGPAAPIWSYKDPSWLYAWHLSGAYRLPNGNTIAVEGDSGHVFEVTHAGAVVWEYTYPGQVARVERYWTVRRGDLNCDGHVDFGDINPFVMALSNPAGYMATYPSCYLLNGDINADGKVDFGDINPFVRLLTNP